MVYVLKKFCRKDTIFIKIKKRTKKDQKAKSFYFWQTVSKKMATRLRFTLNTN